MARNAATAIAWARSQIGSTQWRGLCERFTRTALGLGSSYPSANAAWWASGEKHPGDFNAPAGVPVFWDLAGPNAPYGHVALSIGGGRAISSSNEHGVPVVSEISIRGFTDAYARYRGWARIYHGVYLDIGAHQSGTITAPPIESEEDNMNAAQEAKLNRALENSDLALRALTQTNERVYGTEQKVNHIYEAVDHLLRAVTQVNDRTYLTDVQSKAAVAQIGEVAELLKNKGDNK